MSAPLPIMITALDLAQALVKREFTLHFQPQIDVCSGLVLGAEALVRWKHPVLGLISPGYFIPSAQESGLIVPLGEWVLRKACERTVQWTEMSHIRLHVAVNLSAQEISGCDFASKAKAILRETGLRADQLEIEISWETAMQLIKDQKARIQSLRLDGVSLVIENVGRNRQGTYELPAWGFDKIKIDQALVRDLASDETCRKAIVDIVEAAHGRKLNVIAQGVETAEQFDWLAKQNVDVVQGYYVGRPLSVLEVCEAYEELAN